MCRTVAGKELGLSYCVELLQRRSWTKVIVKNCYKEGTGVRWLCIFVAGKELELDDCVKLLQGRS